jgi:hypothetical protein
MRRFLIAGFLVVSLTVTPFLYGCARRSVVDIQDPTLAAVVCGGAGAVAGAALAAAVARENKPWWTLVGSLFGALASASTCYAVVKVTSTPVEDCRTTKQQEQYRPAQGTVVHVKAFEVKPDPLRAGQNFIIRSQYVVMTPEPDADITVVETRSVSFYDDREKQWKEIGSIPTKPTVIKCGTRDTETVLSMPDKPAGGRALLTFHVESDNISDQQSQERNIVMPPPALAPGLPSDMRMFSR